ncbi:hypothetical protein HC928_04650 [bacterium]|nr:hypothetical protein [bacterium]
MKSKLYHERVWKILLYPLKAKESFFEIVLKSLAQIADVGVVAEVGRLLHSRSLTPFPMRGKGRGWGPTAAPTFALAPASSSWLSFSTPTHGRCAVGI